MCMYLLWFCLFPDTPHYLVQKWDLFKMARAQRVRRGGQPDKEMETLPRTTTKDTVILHINHTLRTSVCRSRIFFNPAMVSSGLHTYQFLLLVHLQCYPFWCHPFQFIAHSCTFFFTNLSLCSFNISFIFAFFFVTTTYSLSLWLCVHVFEHYWVPLLLKCTKCTTSWKRASVPRQKAK